MSDKQKKFHEFAIKSSLFKGRADLYFCYLKAEKIAHVLVLLSQKANNTQNERMQSLIESASLLPEAIASFAAGQTDAAHVLSDVFALLSMVRLYATEGLLQADNSVIIVQEYEHVAEKLTAEGYASPFVSESDFSIPLLSGDTSASIESQNQLSASPTASRSPKGFLKDISKGHSKGQNSGNRMSLILDIVRKNKGISIKAISAVVKDCSEKTIQREL